MRRRLVETSTEAQALIAAGDVLASGVVATNAARLVDDSEPLLVTKRARFVGRGGEKLDAALERFAVDVDGLRALDAGSSTGGFTDCLLQRGASSVIAVDVGTRQLHERLRSDARVDVREQTDIRSLDPDALGGPADIVVCDVSFISIRTVARSLVGLVADRGVMVVLVKPQFEAARSEVSKGRGVISDPDIWRRCVAEAIDALSHAGTAIIDAMVSPLRGAEGNVEFLVLVGRHGHPDAPRVSSAPDRSSLIDALIAEATIAQADR